MITTTDIANIMYKDCQRLGIHVVPDGEVLTGELHDERVVIHSKSQQPEKYFRKSFCEVNICIPDLYKGQADSARLNEAERQALQLFDNVYGESDDGTPYRYSVNNIGIEADDTLKCHYVNVRLLFEVLNIREL